MDRIGYYQDKHWIITDIKHLALMLKEQKEDPKKQWNNGFITSLNEVELFIDAIWSDGEHELKPRKIAKGKIEVSYQAPAATLDEEPKKKEE